MMPVDLTNFQDFSLFLLVKGWIDSGSDLALTILQFLFDHGNGLVSFFGLLVTFVSGNLVLTTEVSKQIKRSVSVLLVIVTYLILNCMTFMIYVFEDQKLCRVLILLPIKLDSNTTMFALLWLLVATDYVAKFLTMIVKACLVVIPQNFIPFRKRGKYYLIIESSSQLYRCLLPVGPWLLYLSKYYEGTNNILSTLICSIYIMGKAIDLFQRGRAWKIAIAKFLQPVNYGTSPSALEMEKAGSCPICHDSFKNAIRLSCSHIFCEECASSWFDRERSCPICRARVEDDPDPMYWDGSTSCFIQMF